MNTYSVRLVNKMSYPVRTLLGYDESNLGVFQVLTGFEKWGPITVDEKTYKYLISCQPNVRIIDN